MDREQTMIARHELARIVLELSRAVEQTSELLEAATDLHRKAVDLQATLTEPLVDLERVLKEESKQTSKKPARVV
jgi:hypothetical protein